MVGRVNDAKTEGSEFELRGVMKVEEEMAKTPRKRR